MNASKKYYKAIYRRLPLKRHKKKQYLSAMLNSLREYELENPDATYEELVKNFGTPDCVATGIIEMSSEEVTQVSRHHLNRNLVYVCVIVVMAMLCLVLYRKLVQKYQSKVIYVQSEIREYDSWPFDEDISEDKE